jgi:tetratricopeptide (TPR) repeat protein
MPLSYGVKKFLFFPVILILILCFPRTLDSEEIIDDYFTNLKSGEYGKAFSLLADEERKNITLNDFEEYMAEWDNMFNNSKKLSLEFYKFLKTDYLDYRVLSEKREKDTRLFEIEITYPDIFVMGFDLGIELPELSGDAELTAEIEVKVKKALKKLFPDGPVTYMDKRQYKIVKENNVFKLITGISNDISEYKAQILMGEAFTAKMAGELEKAIRLYKEALSFFPEDENIKGSLKSCEREMEKRNMELNQPIDPYITQHLKIKNPELVSSDFGLQIKFQIKNTGDKAVRGIELRIVYYSDTDQLIKIYSFSPMAISSWDMLEAHTEMNIEDSVMFFPTSVNWENRKFKVDITGFEED